MTTKEVAETLGTTPNVITENGKKLFPNKEVQRGKAVDWTDEEVTVLIDHMQNNPSNNAGNQLISSTYKSSLATKLTPALKIQQAMLLMQEGYEEEIARLKSENKQQQLSHQAEKQQLLEEVKTVKGDALLMAGWSEQRSVNAYSIVHHLNWGLSKKQVVGKQLAAIARQFNHNVGKVTDRDWGEVNAYGPDTWALWESKFKK